MNLITSFRSSGSNADELRIFVDAKPSPRPMVQTWTLDLGSTDDLRIGQEERDNSPRDELKPDVAGLGGKLGRSKVAGVHFKEANEISIEGDCSQLILDGETFRAEIGRPIFLKLAQPLSFVRIAA